MKKLLISGTGRCGTGCISKVLTANGIKCGHENVYGIDGVKEWGNYQADSSWLAIPYYPSFNGIRILIIREPIACISSLISCKLFIGNNNPYNKYIRRLKYRLGFTEAIRFYIEVNSILFINCDYVIDIDYLEKVLPNVKRWKYYNHRKKEIKEGDYIEAIELHKQISSQCLQTSLLKELKECHIEIN